MSKQVIIIGGGASGFFCAANINNKNVRVTILEKQKNVLQKVKVSGGGRCNVTHACFVNSELLKKYPRGKALLKKTFTQFSPTNTIAWFEQRGVKLKTEADGRMFPQSDSSQTIIDTLLHACNQQHVEVKLKQEVVQIKKSNNRFTIQCSQGESYEADYLVMALGGLPKIEQYAMIQSMGHSIIEPTPSLFTFNATDDLLKNLMGISVPEVSIKIEKTNFENTGSLLITHWGFSGPAILKLSAFAAKELKAMQYQFQIHMNWVNIPEHKLREQWNNIREKQSALTLQQKNPFQLPQRLWDYLLHKAEIKGETKWSELNAKAQNKLIHILTTQSINISGKTTFKEEFVTAGGVDTKDINPKTMESKHVANLYFSGELLDVDGITGGFNFQHAWTSGYLIAQDIESKEM